MKTHVAITNFGAVIYVCANNVTTSSAQVLIREALDAPHAVTEVADNDANLLINPSYRNFEPKLSNAAAFVRSVQKYLGSVAIKSCVMTPHRDGSMTAYFYVSEDGRYRFARVEVNESPTSLTLGSVTSGVARELLSLF